MRTIALPLLLAAAASPAATFTWDINGTTAGYGGTGTWNTTNTFWDDSATGSNLGTDATQAVTPTTADIFVFSGTAGTVTLGTSFSIASLSLSTDNYVIDTGANTLTLNSAQGIAATASATITGKLALGANQASAGWTVTAGKKLTIDAVLSGAFAFRRAQQGTIALNALNTYSGATQLVGGTTEAKFIANGGSDSSIGRSSNAASNLVLNGGKLFYVGESAASTDRLFQLGGNSFIGNNAASASHSLQFTNAGAMGYTVFTADRTLTLEGSNTGDNRMGLQLVNVNATYKLGITKTGAGTWSLRASNNSYTGNTSVAQGVLGFVSGGLGSTGLIQMNGGTLRWESGNTQDISARLVMSNGVAATFDTNGNDVTLATAFGSSSTGSLVKAGSGILTLGGNNTYSGTTTIGAGSVSGTTTSLKGTLSVAFGASLRFAQSTDGTFAGTLLGSGALFKSGSGSVTLTGANTSFLGDTTVEGGVLKLGNDDALGDSAITVAGGVLDLDGRSVGNAINVTSGGLRNVSSFSNVTLGTTTFSLSGSVSGLLNAAGSTIDTTGGLTVNGTLKGAGASLGGGLVTFASGAVHAPGDSPGLQTFTSGLTYGAGSILEWEFVDSESDVAGSSYDAIEVTGGSLFLAAGFILKVVNSTDVTYTAAAWDVSRTFHVISVSDGSFVPGAAPSLDTGLAGNFSAHGVWMTSMDANGLYLNWTPVPEPSTYGLILGSLALAGAAIRRRRSK